MGVTIYCTVPGVVLLGLFSTWAMVLPEPALAPVMLPVMVPMVQLNVLGAEAVNGILVATPLQAVAVLALVTAGRGLTVVIIE